MKIYNYHSEYKYFINTSIADESPLEPGVFLIPAHATDIEPPTCESNQIQIFNGSSWDIVDDKRGTYYTTVSSDNIQIQLIENYNPLETPENSTKEVPPEIPEGYYLIWDDGWVIKQKTVLTPEEKLRKSGLTVEELKSLLGLTP
jgi:hypothetical protein